MPPETSPLRLYLTSVHGDMDGERAIIEGMVLPELRELAAKEGIRIALVDPWKETDAPWDLARRFREIDECRPFFIALLGERYGAPPPAVPLELVAAQPWLVADTGRSLLELEILHGALRDPSAATGSFFYFRSPHFPSLVSEQHRARFLAESPEAGERLSRLKDRIRASGRPVFGYPCGWSERLARAARLEALAEQMVEDLWRAIQEHVRQPKSLAVPAYELPTPLEPIRVHLPPEKALPVHEDVQFTVYRPKAVEPLKWVPLLAFAHLSELPADAAPDEPDPIEEVKAQAQRLLGDLSSGYADVKQDSRHAVPHEAEITFLPEIPGFEVNPPRRTFLWLESVHREEFRIRAGPDLDGTLVRGRMTVFWGSILLAEISLGIRVDSRLAGASAQPPPEKAASRPFRGIFPSYSHRDAGIVEEFERYARTLGDRYLRDVHELRAGEVWNDRLKDLIRQADVFQLFWSWNAMRSPYVEEEWRYALSLGRSHFVRPTYWEDPLPELPERSLPPEDLRRLHFQLLSTGTAQHATAHGSAEPSRDFDPNATILAFPSAPSPPEPDLDDTRAAAPSPAAPAPPLDDTAVRSMPPLPMALPPRPPLPPEVAVTRPQLPPIPTGHGSEPTSVRPIRTRQGLLRTLALVILTLIGARVMLHRTTTGSIVNSPVGVPEPTPVPMREPTPVPMREPAPAPMPEPAPAPMPVPTPVPMPEPAPMPIAFGVTSIDLGKVTGLDKKISEPAKVFSPQDTIYASVSTDGEAPTAVIKAKWTYGDAGQIIKEEEITIAPTGPATTEFRISKPSGWPLGEYKIEIFVDGISAGIQEFEVKR